MRFVSFLSAGFTTKAVINPPERKLANTPLYSGMKLPEYALAIGVSQINEATLVYVSKRIYLSVHVMGR